MMACREFIEAAPARVSGLLAANNLYEACTAVVLAVKKVTNFFHACSLHGLYQTARKFTQGMCKIQRNFCWMEYKMKATS